MLNSKHLSDIDKKGYTIIKSFFNEKKVNSWKFFWDSLEKYALENFHTLQQPNNPINITLGGDTQKYIQRLQHVLLHTPDGKKFIEETNKLIQQINPKSKYLKDRYIIQKAKSLKCELPHQDIYTSCLEELGSEVYTVYISLTDTDENTGTLFVENIEGKRTESLGLCGVGCTSGATCLCSNRSLSLEQIKNYTGQFKTESQHKLIPTSLAAGDCIIFDGFLLHGTAVNTGDHNRKTMTLTYMIPYDSSKDLVKEYEKYRRKIISVWSNP